MSIKLRGLPVSAYRSKVEHSYMREGDAIVLENVPCEMTFESMTGFMEHESEAHDYLPVFHLSGVVREIRGKFPFNVTTLYFMDTDRQFITKDCVYYPTPDELVHMIKTGMYFTKRFELPDLMLHNTYSFPVLANLTIIPPHNPAAYEQATFSGVADPEAAGIDKTNLPIFYVGLAGTGVTKKTDKLLDYYGITLDEEFASYVLTAESAGYTDPPLMNYIPEPEAEPEHEVVETSDYYISAEEEKDLIRARQEEAQKTQEEKAAELQQAQEQEFQEDTESLILAKADRDVARRLEKLIQSEKTAEAGKQAQDQVQKSDDFIKAPEPKKDLQAQQQVQPQRSDDFIKIPEPRKEVQEQRHVQAQPQPHVQPQAQPKPEAQQDNSVRKASAERLAKAQEAVRRAEAARAAKQAAAEGRQAQAQPVEKAAEPAQQAQPVKEPEVVKPEPAKPEPVKVTPSAPFRSDDMITAPPEPERKEAAPDVPQQYKESQMDFNQDRNEFIEQHREDVKAAEQAGLPSDDVHTLRDQKGSDVQNTALQSKIDDAKALAAAQEAARQVQKDITVDGVIGEAPDDVKAVSEETKPEAKPAERKMTHAEAVAARAAREQRRVATVHREVSQNLQDVADKADAALEEAARALNDQQRQ